MTWQPIETAPKDGTRVLVRIRDFVDLAEWYAEGGYWVPSRNDRMRDPTHWMPLPEPPKEPQMTWWVAWLSVGPSLRSTFGDGGYATMEEAFAEALEGCDHELEQAQKRLEQAAQSRRALLKLRAQHDNRRLEVEG